MTIQSNHRRLSLTLITSMLAMAALAAANPASAQSVASDAPISVKVQIADLDLTRAADARVMYDRIRIAAITACGGQTDLRMPDRRKLFDRCRDQTIDQALDELHSPQMAALAGRSTTVLVARR